MTYPLVNSMKLHQNKSSMQQQTSDQPWVDCPDGFDSWKDKLNRPNPPTPEMIERAKFVDKTYTWNGR